MQMLRFVVVFLSIQAVLFTAELTPPGQRYLVQPFTAGLASVSAVLISATGREIYSIEEAIFDVSSGYGVEIAAGCNGIEAMILLLAVILAFPAPWRHRVAGIAMGVVAIQGLNLLRIVSLFFLGLWHPTAFEWAHLYLWQALIMLDVVLVFLLWLRTLPRTSEVDALAAL
jgi:exosortase H (IPTLxxWG-CTERM-specific)